MHLRVYGWSNHDYQMKYAFRIANGVPRIELESGELIQALSIPKQFHSELAEFLGRKNQRSIGIIYYNLTHDEAESERYHPKGDFDPRKARGLGYYLEAIAVNHLKARTNLKGVRTTENPSLERIGQLHKVGLLELNEKEKELLGDCRKKVENGGVSGIREQELLSSLREKGKLPVRHSFAEWLQGMGRGINASQQKKAKGIRNV